MKKILVLGFALGSLAITTVAFAETDTTTANTVSAQATTLIQGVAPTQDSKEIRKELYEKQQELRKEALDNQKEQNEMRKEEREMHKASSTEAREVRKEEREMHKASSTEAREVRKDDREVRKASSSAAREEIKRIKDQRELKAGIERATHTMKRLNEKALSLDKLSARIAEHLALRESKGADTTAAEAKLVEARTAITTAKSNIGSIGIALEQALNAQSTSTSSINVNNVVKNLKPQVQAAERSIHDAEKALRNVMKVRTPKIAPVTGTPVATTSTATTTQ